MKPLNPNIAHAIETPAAVHFTEALAFTPCSAATEPSDRAGRASPSRRAVKQLGEYSSLGSARMLRPTDYCANSAAVERMGEETFRL